MCRFHDVCLNHSSLEWQYYVDPEQAEVPLFYHYLNGHAVYEFPGDFIMTGHVHILPYTSWAPKVPPPSPPSLLPCMLLKCFELGLARLSTRADRDVSAC